MPELISALTVGTITAKGILKLWMKGKGEAMDTVAESIQDLVSKRVADQIAQRRTARQFEALAERIAENLLPLFGGSGLTPQGQQAVLLAVGDVLNKVVPTAQLLADVNLDADRLATHFLAVATSAHLDFQANEEALLERVLRECAAYIADTASQLPRFQQATAAELLRRDDLILGVGTEILDEIRRIRESDATVGPDAAGSRFEESYRRAVARLLDRSELYGVDVTHVVKRRRLSVAYVSLTVAKCGTDRSPLPIDTADSTDEHLEVTPIEGLNDEPGEEDEEEEERLRSVEEALAKAPRMLLRGLPGSGKTTLLQWIAVKASVKGFPATLETWQPLIPFFIKLRQIASKALPPAEGFVELLTPAISGEMPRGWVHRRLSSGNAVVLIDGVDELPQTQRPKARRWIEDLVTAFPQARFVVTTRPLAVEPDWLADLAFQEAALQEMGNPDVRRFIEHWHRALIEELQTDEEIQQARLQMANLNLLLTRNRSLRLLASSPLLCAVICAVHRDRNQYLPSDRLELYDACVNMLVDRRDKERDVSIEGTDFPILTGRQKRLLLEDLAFWMMNNSWSIVPVEMARNRLRKKLKSLEPHIRRLDVDIVLRLLLERTGILREPAPGFIDFTHKTFQEYHAAKAALENEEYGVLIDRASDDQWDEVIVMACGLAGVKARRRLISQLIERGDNEQENRHHLHMLAVACLEMAVELGEDIEREVRKRLVRLVPPSTLSEAAALASAGDLAVTYLRYNRRARGRQSCAAARALSLIGTQAAIEALADYATDGRQTVVREVVRAAESLADPEVSRQLLERIQLTTLRLGRIQSPVTIASLKSVINLYVDDASELGGLEALRDLRQLKIVSLQRAAGIGDLSPLGNLRQLIGLALWPDSSVVNLLPLMHLPSLQLLQLGLPLTLDLSPLSSLEKLSHLSIGYNQELEDLRSLSNISTRMLRIQEWQGLRSLDGIESVRRIETLAISDCPRLEDIDALTGVAGLTRVRLKGFKSVDVRLFRHIEGLRELDLDEVGYVGNLQALEEMPTLRSVLLPGNVDYSPPAGAKARFLLRTRPIRQRP